MPRKVHSVLATIRSGQQMSSTFTNSGEIVSIIVPSTFAGTLLTFFSADGDLPTNFTPVYDDAGFQVMVKVAAGNRIVLNAMRNDLEALTLLQCESDQVQSQDVTIKFVIRE